MTTFIPIWRRFRSLPSDSEAASVSVHCIFSLSTLEIACRPSGSGVALIEQEQTDSWRWAIVDDGDVIVGEGHQATECEAKRVAAEAFQMVPA